MACPFFEAKAVYSISATSASETQRRADLPDGPGIADRRPGILGDGGDRGADLGVDAHGDRETRSCLRAAQTAGEP